MVDWQPLMTPQARVLIADNDDGVVQVLQHVLRMAGFRSVEVAPDGAAALERLEHGGIDLVICDLDMPGIGGEELVRRVGEWPHPPRVIVVSAYLDDATREQLGKSPALVGAFSKPFDIARFTQAVRDCLEGDDQVIDGTSEAGGLF